VSEPRVDVVSSHHERAVVQVGDVFIKVETDAGRAAREIDALTTITAVPVPRLVWHQPGPPAVLAIARVAGRPLANYGQPEHFGADEWRAVGAALGALHRETPITDTEAAVGTANVRAFPRHLAAYAQWFRQTRVGDGALIERLTTEAAAFFTSHQPQSARLHGDCQSGHFFIDDGNVSGVIDWADTGVGDPLADLAVLTVDHRHRLGDVLAGYGGNVDSAAIRQYWILRKFAVMHWRVGHGLGIDADLAELPALAL
jgi:aminoglycoside phosphotransferase (APT) family kinase protein